MDMANSATHQSDLKHKGMVVSISIDRISDLPDFLICHILSFLPTKKAIAASILSSGWRLLWTLVPKIDLRDNLRILKTPVTFTYIAYRFLALHTALLLRNFRLTLFTPCKPFHLDTWIRTVIGRKSDDDEKYNRLCCIGSPDGSGCLSLLADFSFDGYEELEDEVEFVKYVLNEARLLNTMAIKIEAKHLKRSVLQRLSMFPRQSTTCLINVE
ncbi:hypothetical protein SO802_014641 [Lithocarpus litseifolius]|uniref:F-box domain-containing protein n=1 Tax=Lithocarpus litseifolius TaxID=425828 RepID=A0AAW2CUM1_9ROSI